jgi:hypothetical protein
VQMREAGRTVYIFRVPGSGGDAPIERLPNLGDDEQIIHQSGFERPEQLGPRRIHWLTRTAKRLREFEPRAGDGSVRQGIIFPASGIRLGHRCRRRL